MAHRLFSTKPIGELHEAEVDNELHRTLDARALVPVSYTHLTLPTILRV